MVTIPQQRHYYCDTAKKKNHHHRLLLLLLPVYIAAVIVYYMNCVHGYFATRKASIEEETVFVTSIYLYFSVVFMQSIRDVLNAGFWFKRNYCCLPCFYNEIRKKCEEDYLSCVYFGRNGATFVGCLMTEMEIRMKIKSVCVYTFRNHNQYIATYIIYPNWNKLKIFRKKKYLFPHISEKLFRLNASIYLYRHVRT